MSTIPPETPVPIPTPTVTHHQQLAERAVKNFDEIAAMLPQEDPGRATTELVRRRQNVSNETLAAVVAAAEQYPEIQAVSRFDISKARDTLQMSEALRPVYDKGRAFFARLRFMEMTRKADVIVEARRFYYHAKGLARDPRYVGLATFVTNVKGQLGGSGSRSGAAQRRAAAKAKADADAAAPPQPPDTTAKPRGEKP